MAQTGIRTMTDNQMDRNDLIEQYEAYVRAVAARLVQRLNLPASRFDECLSAGYLGLVEAAERYDQSSKAQFTSYAYLRIRGAIIDDLRRSSDLSPAAYKYLRALQAYNSCREDEQLQEGLAKDDSRNLNKALHYASQGALAYRLCIYDESAQMDLTDRNVTPEEATLRKERSLRFRQSVAELPEKERFIVEQYYFEGLSFSEIAQRNAHLSKSWISKLHARALHRLRRKLEKDYASS